MSITKWGSKTQDFSWLLEAEWGAGPVYKTHIPMAFVGKEEICADQMIPWLPLHSSPVGACEGWLERDGFQNPGLSELATQLM